MKRSTAKLLQILNTLAVFVLVLIFGTDENAAWLIVLVGLVVSVIIGLFLRCPQCGRGQGRNWLWTQYCPYCGQKLDD